MDETLELIGYFYGLQKRKDSMKDQVHAKKDARRLPGWLKMKLPMGYKYSRVKNLSNKYSLHTICASGNCPNIGECWNNGTATFMILGDICTRNCKFCAVKTGKPLPVDTDEPQRLAESVKILKLGHCVITSVDRDDLPDGGAGIWAETIRSIKKINPHTTLEVLIPDFDGNESLLQMIIEAGPDVISHNLETVRRLTPAIRSRAKYETSLKVIKVAASSAIRSKSGIMLGLGETGKEILETMDDLLEAGCEVLTIGQYLAPSPSHMQVVEYIKPELFEQYGRTGLQKGFMFVESSPLVRSSYHAEKHAGTKKKNKTGYAKESEFSGPRVL
jgi:lipoyl synthase